MINRDPNRDISNKKAGQYFDEVVRSRESLNDIRLLDELVREVNTHGYFIQYYFQLQAMSIKDRELFPVIRKYIGRFDNLDFTLRLISCLGVPKLFEATSFLLELFGDVNKRKTPNSYFSTRQSASSALLRIKDSKYQKEYRDLILSDETHNDAYLLVELLGKFPNPQNYTLLCKLLTDNCADVRAATLSIGSFKSYAKEVIPVLKLLNQSDSSKAVRENAHKSLKKLSKYDTSTL